MPTRTLAHPETSPDTKSDSYGEEETRQAGIGAEIAVSENDYNLNITRYVSTAEPEPIIDLGKTHEAIVATEKDIRKMTAKHNEFLKQLGLPPLP